MVLAMGSISQYPVNIYDGTGTRLNGSTTPDPMVRYVGQGSVLLWRFGRTEANFFDDRCIGEGGGIAQLTPLGDIAQ
jgi:hypothetical protein